jgi:succinate dehydrogenase / fumarate reductase cytochrome b subunit
VKINIVKKRPVNLALWTIRFPLPAITSILHRISGFVLFLFIPIFLSLLAASLGSEESFQRLQTELANPVFKILLWVLLSALAYHVVAGFKHLLMDMGVGETLVSVKITSILTLVISITISAMLAVWLW